MKLGLVLEGGASRTLFSCGVLDFFLDKNLYADYVIGTSAGIAYGVSYTSLQKGRNLEITQKYMADKRYMGMRHLLNKENKSFYNMDFVYDEIPNQHIPFDFDAFASYPGEIIAVATDMETGKAAYLPVDRHDHTFNMLRASCALPILFPKIRIDEHDYMDGGVADSIPFEKAIQDGCDKVIVVLTRERGYVKKSDRSTNAAAAVYRKYPAFSRAIKERAEHYNAALEKLHLLEQSGRAFVITPKTTLGTSRTEKNPKKLTALYKIGYSQAQRSYRDLTNYLTSDRKATDKA